MDLKSIKRLEEIEVQLDKLFNDIYELENQSNVKGQIISDMPKGNGANNSCMTNAIIQREEIEEKINKLKEERSNLRNKASKMIEELPCSEIKTILNLRILEGLTWEVIGFELNLSLSTVRRMFMNHFRSIELKKIRENYINK